MCRCSPRMVWHLFSKLLLILPFLAVRRCSAGLVPMRSITSGGTRGTFFDSDSFASSPPYTNNINPFLTLSDLVLNSSSLTHSSLSPEIKEVEPIKLSVANGSTMDTRDIEPDQNNVSSTDNSVSPHDAFKPVNRMFRSPEKSSSGENEDAILGLYSWLHVPAEEYEVTVPVRVARDGAFLSHQLRAPHRVEHRAGRTRRSLAPGDRLHPEEYHEVVHYNLTVAGRLLRIDLRPEINFISPHLVVERRGWDNRQDRNSRGRAAGAAHSACHYRGQVAGQPHSHVALSACEGLAGLLRTEQGEYWVEPSLHHTRRGLNAAEPHPHVIFKRSAVKARSERRPDKGVIKKKNRGKGKQRKRHRKQRRGKNCSTKQSFPPGRAARRVDWVEGPGRSIMQEAKILGSPPRRPRSVSEPRHVEVLIVADQSMTAFHKNPEDYLLTIMNMVSSLYLDPTIGNFINVVVVKIVLLEKLKTELKTTTNADVTLSDFCRWQQAHNPEDDRHPNHHDVAILITRIDICAKQNVPCSTLGVAHVAGMCSKELSCSVNEDNGITLAHTITHELGHNFGMFHDSLRIGCDRREGSKMHVMTPVFEADTVEVTWSECSRKSLTNFLDSGQGHCLTDVPAPAEDYTYPVDLPGELYNATQQCRLQFGKNAKEVCSPSDELCERLWCVVNGSCQSMMRPAASGTRCGPNMWCQNHACVERSERPAAVHGGWGAWGPWSTCSRSCGGGVSLQERPCDSPRPTNGGTFCTGERTRYKVCNTDNCPIGEPSFRQVQCSVHNGKIYEHKNITNWQAYFYQDEPCQLYCSTPDESLIEPFGNQTQDGTPCQLGTQDMCISGICRKVGCDWELDSNATLDTCGVCRGNNATCKEVRGIYSMDTVKGSGFSQVAVIPAGSRNIKIEEIANSQNYLGIRSAKSRKLYLNGKRKITLAGEYLVAGTPALYERDRDWEKVKIPGPIKEDISIYQMTFGGRHRNPGVIYQYTVDRHRLKLNSGIQEKEREREVRYRWEEREWTPCSQTCGRGSRRRSIVCLDEANGIVDEDNCINQSDTEKPIEVIHSCSHGPCSTPYWWVGPWSTCPSCLKQSHALAVRRRSVICRDREDHRQVPESECIVKNKPVAHLSCPGLPKCHHRY